MAALEYETTETPATVRKEVTCIETLAAGGRVKMEIGENELDSAVPEGKSWDVIANVRIVENNA